MPGELDLQSLHVAITGGARGIGEAPAARLRREGARVALGDVNVASAAGRLGALPGEATYVATKHAVVGLGEAVRAELAGTGVGLTTVLPNLANTRLGSGMRAARGMRKLAPEDVADALVDGLRRRRAEVYVPRSLRTATLLTLALPHRLASRIHKAFGMDHIAQRFDHDARAAYQQAAGRPLQPPGTGGPPPP